MGHVEFRDQLLEEGVLVDGLAPGVYLRSGAFESVIRGIEAYVSAAGRELGALQLHLPPLMARSTLTANGYLGTFPNLVGQISSYEGSEADVAELVRLAQEGGPWESMMSPIDVTLCPAACHAIYPLLEGTAVPDEGRVFEVQCACFRNEPSDDPARLRSFRMHEFVVVGSMDRALAHREEWLERARQLLVDLGLDVGVVVANDMFFGRGGRLLAAGQRRKELKFELVAPISADEPGAIGSGNYHEDIFGNAHHIALRDGTPAHSACVGFGLDRIALALYRRHGFATTAWPEDVTSRLGLATAPAPSP